MPSYIKPHDNTLESKLNKVVTAQQTMTVVTQNKETTKLCAGSIRQQMY